MKPRRPEKYGLTKHKVLLGYIQNIGELFNWHILSKFVLVFNCYLTVELKRIDIKSINLLIESKFIQCESLGGENYMWVGGGEI